jgi:pimeloyl-ACP methyl ester carboxylesterase
MREPCAEAIRIKACPLDQYFETGGARLRYRDEGRGHPVLLVHGWTLDLDMWGAQAAALSDSYRIVRLDRRGFGLSSGHPSIAGDGADLWALCEHLGLKSVSLVGMSQGSRAVVQFAASFPRATSCIVLDGPPRTGTPNAAGGSVDVPYEHYRELARTQGLSAFRDEWSGHALTRLNTGDADTHALLARMIGRYPGRDLIDTAARSDAATPGRNVELMGRPALVINGEFDLESRRGYAKELALRFCHVERVEIPDAGHLCNLDNPRAYNEALRRFLQKGVVPSTGE